MFTMINQLPNNRASISMTTFTSWISASSIRTSFTLSWYRFPRLYCCCYLPTIPVCNISLISAPFRNDKGYRDPFKSISFKTLKAACPWASFSVNKYWSKRQFFLYLTSTLIHFLFIFLSRFFKRYWWFGKALLKSIDAHHQLVNLIA